MAKWKLPRLPRDVVLLRRRLLLEVIVANVVGGAFLVLFYTLFVASEVPFHTQLAFAIVGAICVLAFFLVLAVSYWLARPFLGWLAETDGETTAPDRVKIGVVIQPFVQTSVTVVLWAISAIGFGVVRAFSTTGEMLVPFLTTFSAQLFAAVIVGAIVYLRIEASWRPWLPRFFVDDDPASLPLPRVDLLKARLRWTFVLSSALPLIMMAVGVTYRDLPGITAGRTDLFVWVIAGAGLLAGAVLSWNVRRSIVNPVYDLRDAMEDLTDGDLDVTVPVDRVDELGKLESGFNQMVRGLREREQLADLLNRQVGSEVARAAIAQGGHLGGETRVVTALFVDLAAFTTMAEEHAPNEVATVLNAVFDVVVGAVLSRDGLVNKFQGDAVLAVFGAPRDDDEHAVHALEAAVRIAGGLESLEVEFGIGIASGEVFAGNIGTEDRFEYTVIGDVVNVASRLQELTRTLDRRVLLTKRCADFARR